MAAEPEYLPEEGRKYDTDKVPLFKGTFASFPRAMDAVATLGGFGATKYSWNNWQFVDNGIDRYTDAMVRHLNEEAKGNFLDVESGLPHAYSVAWNALARLELILRNQELLLREKKEGPSAPNTAGTFERNKF